LRRSRFWKPTRELPKREPNVKRKFDRRKEKLIRPLELSPKEKELAVRMPDGFVEP